MRIGSIPQNPSWNTGSSARGASNIGMANISAATSTPWATTSLLPVPRKPRVSHVSTISRSAVGT